MDHPVKEIAGVITSLTNGSPEVQEKTLSNYFLPDASFVHPFCRVPSFSERRVPLLGNVDSLRVILSIYRWYRTLSPKIELTVDSASFDQKNSILYVSIRQTFAVWFIPFYKAPVKLVTVLHLVQRYTPERLVEAPPTNGDQDWSKYYIQRQEDLYQVNDFANFLLPGFGPVFWSAWQLFSTLMCFVLSLLTMPLFLVLNKGDSKKTN